MADHNEAQPAGLAEYATYRIRENKRKGYSHVRLTIQEAEALCRTPATEQPAPSALADEVDIACKAYADATEYYIQFHRGLSSPSADKMRKGMRAALHALRTQPQAARPEVVEADRYHLKEPVIFHTADGPKECGEGWLLITEAEYDALSEQPRTDAARMRIGCEVEHKPSGARGVIVGSVEGWWNVRFKDGTEVVCRPSNLARIDQALGEQR
jgi:hypothetical protein